MSVFDKKQENNETIPRERILTDSILDQQDKQLQIDAGLLSDVNRDPKKATDETLILAYNIGEARKLIVALREKLVLADYWRSKIA